MFGILFLHLSTFQVCLCPRILLANNGLDILPWIPFILESYIKLSRSFPLAGLATDFPCGAKGRGWTTLWYGRLGCQYRGFYRTWKIMHIFAKGTAFEKSYFSHYGPELISEIRLISLKIVNALFTKLAYQDIPHLHAFAYIFDAYLLRSFKSGHTRI